MRILIAEDKARMASLLQRAIQREGYTTLLVNDGAAALQAIQSNHLDAIVMDVMMPRLSGYEVLSAMRDSALKVPTILLTARDSSADIVHGLDLGADDYLTKPFELAVLLARLRAITRRPASLLQPPRLRVGELTLRPETHDLICGSRQVTLTRMQYTLLETLMQRAGQVVRKETLVEAGWGSAEDCNEGTLYVFISALRAKLQTAGSTAVLVTVKGVGYMLHVKAEQ